MLFLVVFVLFCSPALGVLQSTGWQNASTWEAMANSVISFDTLRGGSPWHDDIPGDWYQWFCEILTVTLQAICVKGFDFSVINSGGSDKIITGVQAGFYADADFYNFNITKVQLRYDNILAPNQISQSVAIAAPNPLQAYTWGSKFNLMGLPNTSMSLPTSSSFSFCFQVFYTKIKTVATSDTCSGKVHIKPFPFMKVFYRDVCPTGTIWSNGAEDCIPCSGNGTSILANNTCVCNAGFVGDGITCSVSCPLNSHLVLGSGCQPCPTFSHNSGNGTACICNDGFVLMNQQCVCDNGTYLTGGTCTPCPINSWSTPNATARTDCECNSGYFESGGPDPEFCLQLICPADNYWDHGCAKCPDHSTSHENSTSSTDCICDVGFEKDSITQTTCQPIVCQAGKYLVASTCDSCPINSWSPANTTSLVACQCNAGYTQGGADCVRVSCPADHYWDNGCVHCPAHSSSQANSTSSAACVCNAGFEPDLSHTSCLQIECRVNTFLSLAIGQCLNCSEYASSPANSTAPSACVCNSGYTGSGVFCAPIPAVTPTTVIEITLILNNVTDNMLTNFTPNFNQDVAHALNISVEQVVNTRYTVLTNSSIKVTFGLVGNDKLDNRTAIDLSKELQDQINDRNSAFYDGTLTSHTDPTFFFINILNKAFFTFSQLSTGWLIGILLGFILILLLFYFINRRYFPKAKANRLIMTLFSFACLTTNIAYVIWVHDLHMYLWAYYLALIALLFPFTINSIVIGKTLLNEFEINLLFLNWAKLHRICFVLMWLFGSIRSQNALLFKSRVFHLEIFSSPLSWGSRNRLVYADFISMIFGDIPMLTTQIYLSVAFDSFNTAAALALAFTSVRLCLSVSYRIYTYTLRQQKDHRPSFASSFASFRSKSSKNVKELELQSIETPSKAETSKIAEPTPSYQSSSPQENGEPSFLLGTTPSQVGFERGLTVSISRSPPISPTKASLKRTLSWKLEKDEGQSPTSENEGETNSPVLSGRELSEERAHFTSTAEGPA